MIFDPCMRNPVVVAYSRGISSSRPREIILCTTPCMLHTLGILCSLYADFMKYVQLPHAGHSLQSVVPRLHEICTTPSRWAFFAVCCTQTSWNLLTFAVCTLTSWNMYNSLTLGILCSLLYPDFMKYVQLPVCFPQNGHICTICAPITAIDLEGWQRRCDWALCHLLKPSNNFLWCNIWLASFPGRLPVARASHSWPLNPCQIAGSCLSGINN